MPDKRSHTQEHKRSAGTIHDASRPDALWTSGDREAHPGFGLLVVVAKGEHVREMSRGILFASLDRPDRVVSESRSWLA